MVIRGEVAPEQLRALATNPRFHIQKLVPESCTLLIPRLGSASNGSSAKIMKLLDTEPALAEAILYAANLDQDGQKAGETAEAGRDACRAIREALRRGFIAITNEVKVLA